MKPLNEKKKVEKMGVKKATHNGNASVKEEPPVFW